MSKYAKLGVIVAIVACIFWIYPTFAADAAATAATAAGAVTGSSWMTQLLNAILKFLSWGWMLLAFLAGKLMSNDFVYGTFLHLDSALFQLWNYMKNIANFILGFLFLFGVLKGLFTKDAFEIQNILPRYLLAGVMIQMSWFMMGALIDLSNVATAAVGAFPTQFIQGSTEDMSKSKMMQLAVTVPVRIDVSFKENTPLFSTHEGTQTIEQMFGKFNDMSGPLLFMGAAIFRFQDYDIMNQDVSNWKNFSIGLFIKLFLLIAFTVPMFALIAINFIRIFRLRMRIAFAPLAAIARSFDDKMTPKFIKDLGDKKSIGFGKIGDVLALVFQPVAMIGAISLAMILSIGIYYVLGGDPGDQKSGSEFNHEIENLQVTSKDKTSTLKDKTTGTEISIDGNLFKEMGNFVGGMIGYLIITGFSVVLIWSLLKIGASFSTFTKDAATGIFNFSEKLVANSNIIPFGSGLTSFAALNKTKNDAASSLTSGSYASSKVDEQTNKLRTSFYKTDVGKGVKNTFNIQDDTSANDISLTEQNSLLQAANGGVDAILKGIRETLAQKNVTARSRNFSRSFDTIMNQNKEFKDFVLAGTGVSQEDFESNKNNLLGATNDVGAKMRKFMAYVVNSDVKKGSSLSPTIVDEFINKKLKTTEIATTTPFFIAQKAS